MVRERAREGVTGVPVLIVVLLGGVGLFLNVVRTVSADAPPPIVAFTIIGSIVLFLFMIAGFFIVNPNEGVVLQLFGTYAGTARTAGLRWLVPFYTRKRISLRVRSFESSHLKVNDQ